jgi:hypothetical protein
MTSKITVDLLRALDSERVAIAGMEPAHCWSGFAAISESRIHIALSNGAGLFVGTLRKLTATGVQLRNGNAIL